MYISVYTYTYIYIYIYSYSGTFKPSGCGARRATPAAPRLRRKRSNRPQRQRCRPPRTQGTPRPLPPSPRPFSLPNQPLRTTFFRPRHRTAHAHHTSPCTPLLRLPCPSSHNPATTWHNSSESSLKIK